MKKTGVIYKAVNRTNGKIYVGQTRIGLHDRIRKHVNSALNERHKGYGTYFSRAVRKYGRDGFDWEILEEIDIESLNDREVFWIEQLDSMNKKLGYNLTPGGYVSSGRKGQSMSKESREKVSKGLKEYFRKHGNPKKGTKISAQTRKNMSIAQRKLGNTMEERWGRDGARKFREKVVGKLRINITNKEIQSVTRKFVEGATLKSLAKEYSRDPCTIRRILANSGMSEKEIRKKMKDGNKQRGKNVADYMRKNKKVLPANLINSYAGEQKTTGQIAKILNISPITVRKRLREAGVYREI